VLFLVNVFRRTWRLAVLSFGLMVFSAFVIGGAWPLTVQRFQVEPTQDVKESEFIARNIEATLGAYGLDEVDRALDDLREGRVSGSLVVRAG